MQWVRLVLFAILLAILATVRPTSGGDCTSILLATAASDVRVIADAVSDHHRRFGRVPTSLHELVIRDDRGRSSLEDLPLDPWGNAFELRDCGEPPRTFVVSAGPNGVFGDSDDVSAATIRRR
jgi:hypothetical protein